uniref:Uncharacterized protein n=2 Tax=Lutzomyia longipalpis TaxID=7200 RepID=A0A1B0CDE4_LUTLO
MEEEEKPLALPISPRKIKREKETPPREKEPQPADLSTFLGTLFGIEPRNEEDEKKSVEPMKTSDEILTELFQVFNAAPPKKILGKTEKKDKSKKKHKKHKKKSKKKKKDGDEGESSSDSEQSEKSRGKRVKQEEDEERKKSKKSRKKSPEKVKIEVPEKVVEPAKELSKKEEEKDTSKQKEPEGKSHRIIIKDLKNSTILSEATKVEKEKEKSRDHHHSRDRSSRKRHRDEIEDRRKRIDRDLSDFSISDEEEYHHREYLPLRSRGDSHDGFDRRRRERRSSRSRHDDGFRGSSYRGARDRFWGSRRRDRSRSRSRSRSEKSSEKIDKKKLLEIARKNAIVMLKNGTLPGCQNLAPADKAKALAKMTHGGKTIEELTDYCKKLSNGETLNDLSSASSANEDSDHDRDGNAKPFHHPFVVKDRGPIVMNIKNSVPIPPKTAEQTKALLMQFPVSSGQHHRATESEWVPVSPKKPDPPKEPKKTAPIPAKQLSQAFYTIPTEELPPPTPAHPTQELMNNTQKDMSNWATSKFTPGKFLGSTGANILSAKELQSGFQAWAKRDQLISTAPVSGGMGMHLLQKMGWRPGEALGKDKSGSLQPLLLEVKLDKRGLAAIEENPHQANKKRRMTAAQAKEAMQNKHPVSLLGEISSKRKWLSPIYEVVMESGPGHHKNFLFRVTLNGVSYTPQTPSNNKKEAKAVAARCCLQQLGILP